MRVAEVTPAITTGEELLQALIDYRGLMRFPNSLSTPEDVIEDYVQRHDLTSSKLESVHPSLLAKIGKDALSSYFSSEESQSEVYASRRRIEDSLLKLVGQVVTIRALKPGSQPIDLYRFRTAASYPEGGFIPVKSYDDIRARIDSNIYATFRSKDVEFGRLRHGIYRPSGYYRVRLVGHDNTPLVALTFDNQ